MKSGEWVAAEFLSSLQRNETTAFRLWSDGERWLDWWDGRVVFSASEQQGWEGLFAETGRVAKAAGLAEPVSFFFRKLVRNPGPSDIPLLLAGRVDPDSFPVTENGMRFVVSLADGYSAGLFPDQRDNRSVLRDVVQGRVLNCFAYTCAFSVAAALSGASTVSVDIASRCLQRGRENFERNGISKGEHKFLAEDVLDYLPRLIRRGERYSWIIMDPPTFARGRKGRVLRAAEDYPLLIELAYSCAAEGARILFSTNCRSLDTFSLAALAEERAAAIGCSVVCEPGKIPADFAESDSSSTVWVTISNIAR